MHIHSSINTVVTSACFTILCSIVLLCSYKTVNPYDAVRMCDCRWVVEYRRREGSHWGEGGGGGEGRGRETAQWGRKKYATVPLAESGVQSGEGSRLLWR